MKFREAKAHLDPLNVVQVGQLNKPHGYKGHLKFELYFAPDKLKEESVLVGINDWLVPFFIDYQQSNFHAIKPIIKFEEVNTEQEAQTLAHSPIILPRPIAKKYVDLDSPQFMIGYQVIDITSNKSGRITAYIHNEKNPLLQAFFDKKEYLLPLLGVIVVKVNHKNREVKIKLPQGLID